jgi:hypothetical protein
MFVGLWRCHTRNALRSGTIRATPGQIQQPITIPPYRAQRIDTGRRCPHPLHQGLEVRAGYAATDASNRSIALRLASGGNR